MVLDSRHKETFLRCKRIVNILRRGFAIKKRRDAAISVREYLRFTRSENLILALLDAVRGEYHLCRSDVTSTCVGKLRIIGVEICDGDEGCVRFVQDVLFVRIDADIGERKFQGKIKVHDPRRKGDTRPGRVFLRPVRTPTIPDVLLMA